MSTRLGYKLIPPAGYDALTSLFGVFSRENARIRRDLVRLLGMSSEGMVLDVGAGPGAQSALIASIFPDATVVALEPDTRSIEFARRKNNKRGLGILFARGVGEEIPFKSETFDFVVSTAMIHHLPTESKKMCFREIHRVLKKKGVYGIIESGKPRTIFGKIVMFPLKSGWFEYQADCMNGLIPSFLEEAGFKDIEEQRTLWYLGASTYLARKG